MNKTPSANPTTAREQQGETCDFDVVVVGAGFGRYVHAASFTRLGDSMLRVYETGDGVGGTWYWNRYPGARCDIESMQYSYSFSEELDQEWTWSEKYSPQAEILAYANHVADRYELRNNIRFKTRVTTAVLDEQANRWCIGTGPARPSHSAILHYGDRLSFSCQCARIRKQR